MANDISHFYAQQSDELFTIDGIDTHNAADTNDENQKKNETE